MRLILLFCLLTSVNLAAGVPQKSVVIAPVKVSRISANGAVTGSGIGLNIERGMRSILESRGTRVNSLPQSQSYQTAPDAGAIKAMAESAEADMVYVTEIKLIDYAFPSGDLTATFCGETSDDLPVRGKLSLSIRAFSAAGQLLWTAESLEPYRCAEPTIEAWSQVMTLLDKAPL
ncbi:MAG: hypothetical protein K8S54_01345 [Spirochaetia bacterium]|nr:hypothetical protein [Spirochaetia bacterium]